MGSEMCIRDSTHTAGAHHVADPKGDHAISVGKLMRQSVSRCTGCLLYTSDAADERSSVDLGGRRIIKKKNRRRISATTNVGAQNG